MLPDFRVVVDIEPIYAEFLFGYESGRLAIIAVHLYNAVQDVDFFLVRLNGSAVAIELQRFKQLLLSLGNSRCNAVLNKHFGDFSGDFILALRSVHRIEYAVNAL